MTSATDWNAYYRRPARQARLTRQITGRLLLDLIRRHAEGDPHAICEIGGANSCFYDRVRQAYPHARYAVIDNNAFGLGLLRERGRGDPLLTMYQEDVLRLPDGMEQADIVYSVGLIEHFSPVDTATSIRKHFSCARPGGLVIITFPTPTWLYRATRALAERLGVWRFPDERPLSLDEVKGEVSKSGTIVETRVNWAIVLTQGIVVARAC